MEKVKVRSTHDWRRGPDVTPLEGSGEGLRNGDEAYPEALSAVIAAEGFHSGAARVPLGTAGSEAPYTDTSWITRYITPRRLLLPENSDLIG